MVLLTTFNTDITEIAPLIGIGIFIAIVAFTVNYLNNRPKFVQHPEGLSVPVKLKHSSDETMGGRLPKEGERFTENKHFVRKNSPAAVETTGV